MLGSRNYSLLSVLVQPVSMLLGLTGGSNMHSALHSQVTLWCLSHSHSVGVNCVLFMRVCEQQDNADQLTAVKARGAAAGVCSCVLCAHVQEGLGEGKWE